MRDNEKTIKQLIKSAMPLFNTIFDACFSAVKELYQTLIKKLRFSITFKMTAVYTIIFIRLLILFNFLIFACFVFYNGKNAEDKLSNYNKFITSKIKDSINIPTNDISQISKLGNIYISVFDEHGKVTYASNNNSVSKTLYTKQNKNKVLKLNSDYILVTNNNIIYLVLNNSIFSNSNIIYLQSIIDLSSDTISISVLVIVLLIIDFLSIFMTISRGSKASKKMLMPVEIMTNTVKKININALATRLDISGSQDELKELAQTFNDMLDRLQHSYEIQNQFVSDASHELRTPIAVIQGYINLLDRWGKDDRPVLEESIEAIKDEAENMKNLVEKLLFLARSDKNTQKVEKALFNLDDLILEVVKETRLIDSTHEITNTRNESIKIFADLKLLKEALRIFIDNSIKYTPANGKISIDSCMQNNQAVITISDTGIGISKEDLPNIFNRFYRADKSRTKETGGTGLGLSIAKWIILKHKGTIQVDSTLNYGTKITLFLPIQ